MVLHGTALLVRLLDLRSHMKWRTCFTCSLQATLQLLCGSVVNLFFFYVLNNSFLFAPRVTTGVGLFKLITCNPFFFYAHIFYHYYPRCWMSGLKISSLLSFWSEIYVFLSWICYTVVLKSCSYREYIHFNLFCFILCFLYMF